MNFRDKEVEDLDVKDIDNLAYLIVNKLCGKNSIKYRNGKFEYTDI